VGLVDRARAFLARKLKLGAGVAVTYSRGTASTAMTAWVGNTLFARAPRDPGGAAVEWGERDYLFDVADLREAGVFPPRKGDRITEVIDTVSVVYEPATPTGEPYWRYSDPGLTLVRVHCQRVG
jgi:hypothetical protein